MSGELAPVEQFGVVDAVRLAELERVVDAGLQVFVDVGLALAEIRDGRLYRQTHDTFEAYLDERFGISRAHGYRLIDAAHVAKVVSPMGDIANERQARELVPLLDEPDELVDVVRELRAEHGGKLTAEKVRRAVDERMAVEQRVGSLLSSASVEWYTPAPYVDAVREVLGGIDLDPASCEQANRTVRATHYYDAATDGLAHGWRGRVFMNPPYGPLCPRFVAKALAEYATGEIEAAILLLNGYSHDAGWFQPLWDHLLCFARGRIRFSGPSGDPGRPSASTVFVYLGAERARFAQLFSGFGAVVERSPLALEEPPAS